MFVSKNINYALALCLFSASCVTRAIGVDEHFFLSTDEPTPIVPGAVVPGDNSDKNNLDSPKESGSDDYLGDIFCAFGREESENKTEGKGSRDSGLGLETPSDSRLISSQNGNSPDLQFTDYSTPSSSRSASSVSSSSINDSSTPSSSRSASSVSSSSINDSSTPSSSRSASCATGQEAICHSVSQNFADTNGDLLDEKLFDSLKKNAYGILVNYLKQKEKRLQERYSDATFCIERSKGTQHLKVHVGGDSRLAGISVTLSSEHGTGVFRNCAVRSYKHFAARVNHAFRDPIPEETPKPKEDAKPNRKKKDNNKGKRRQ